MTLESRMVNNPSFKLLVELNSKLNSELLFSETSTLKSVADILNSMRNAYSSLVSEDALSKANYKPVYFTLDEYCNSVTASRLNINNRIVPDSSLAANFRFLCYHILDPAREELGAPIMITSGFRSIPLNKAVGGVVNSRHTIARAADLVCHDNDKLYDILLRLPHKELIKHSTYIHVAI